jgi:hypothetical protein
VKGATATFGAEQRQEEPKPIQVAVYTRVGRADDLESLRQQEEAIEDYLASGEIKSRLRVGGTYRDIGNPANE